MAREGQYSGAISWLALAVLWPLCTNAQTANDRPASASAAAPRAASAALRRGAVPQSVQVLDELILPKLHAYEPELVMISAGYDCHRDDPLGSMAVDEDGFGAMTSRLIELAQAYADGRIVLVLEGGYDPPALARSVVRTIRTLDGAV